MATFVKPKHLFASLVLSIGRQSSSVFFFHIRIYGDAIPYFKAFSCRVYKPIGCRIRGYVYDLSSYFLNGDQRHGTNLDLKIHANLLPFWMHFFISFLSVFILKTILLPPKPSPVSAS